METQPKLRRGLTKQQFIHTAIHSSKWPITYAIGAYFGLTGVGAVFIAVIISWGWGSELLSDFLYWRALNARPRSGIKLNEALEHWGARDCANCGHSLADHDTSTVMHTECSLCGCKFDD